MLTDIRALADHFLIALPNINTRRSTVRAAPYTDRPHCAPSPHSHRAPRWSPVLAPWPPLPTPRRRPLCGHAATRWRCTARCRRCWPASMPSKCSPSPREASYAVRSSKASGTSPRWCAVPRSCHCPLLPLVPLAGRSHCGSRPPPSHSRPPGPPLLASPVLAFATAAPGAGEGTTRQDRA